MLMGMRRTVRDERTNFRQDPFLHTLSQMSQCRFSLLEHAPQQEREDKFTECIQHRRLPITLIDLGVNVELELTNPSRNQNTPENGRNKVYFESVGFIFNGVWVRVVGWMNKTELSGQAKFEFVEGHSTNEIDHLSIHEIQILRANGLPIEIDATTPQSSNSNTGQATSSTAQN